MPEPGAAEFVPRPASGRVYERGRRIRLADVDPTGRCRLDSLVRHLQDVARDDSADSGLLDPMNWVVRRTLLEVHTAPVFQEWVELATWCSGHGSRWAERRTALIGAEGARVSAVTLWIHVDPVTGRPRRLNPDFFEIYGATAGDRIVSARQSLATMPSDDAHDEAWMVRFADLDILGHVNNAAQWVPVEEVLARTGVAPTSIRAEVEHGAGVEQHHDTRLRWVENDGGIDTWLMTDGVAGSVARVRPIRV
jgi:acyl-ACP thioesterase